MSPFYRETRGYRIWLSWLRLQTNKQRDEVAWADSTLINNTAGKVFTLLKYFHSFYIYLQQLCEGWALCSSDSSFS